MTLDESIHLVIQRLHRNRKFPKYQLERSIDGFLALFLEEYLALHFGAPVVYVAAEFPLKKAGNNQSTNVDYLYLKGGSAPQWIFVELKTDPYSLREAQLHLYAETAATTTMQQLVQQVEQGILPKSKRKEKYRYLLEVIRADGRDKVLDAPINIVCITSHTAEARLRATYPQIAWVHLRDIAAKLTHTQHPELWRYVKDLVLSLGEE
jgi:hypothetical protein